MKWSDVDEFAAGSCQPSAFTVGSVAFRGTKIPISGEQLCVCQK